MEPAARYLAGALARAVGAGTHPVLSVAAVGGGAGGFALARDALREVAVAQLALVALLAGELVAAEAAAGVDVALLADGSDHVTAAWLTIKHKHTRTHTQGWTHVYAHTHTHAHRHTSVLKVNFTPLY